MATPTTYLSGEQMQARDHVRYHGEDGRVEFVAEAEDPETSWYVTEFGEGCMVITASCGRVYVEVGDEHLELVARDGA